MELFSENIQIDTLDKAIQLFRESRTGFVKLFNSSPVCMSMTTTDLGRRVYARVNQRFTDIFGFEEAEIIGRTSVEIGILDPAESVRVGNLIKEKGRLQNDYVKCLTKSGQVVHTVSSIEFMEMGGVTYLVSFFVDVTKIVEQQAIIEQHAKQLEEVNKDLESFSYSVSHDLRAPLRAIDGNARILEEECLQYLDEEGKRALYTVLRNAERMGQLIDDLLAFSKLGRQAMKKAAVDMHSLAREVLDDISKATVHKAEVTIGPLHPACGDHSLLRQVLVNLISNAIKYSSKKESPLVTVTSAQEEDHCIYTVSDNGAGFDMNHAGKLFGVFQRLHTGKQFEGTGVGLAIVHRIISRHGGTIRAEGEVGKGAVFTFTLPNR